MNVPVVASGGVPGPREGSELALVREDFAYHQARVLLLVVATAAESGHARKVDGLTKLARLDFLLRYPALASAVLDSLDPHDPRLRLAAGDVEDPAAAEAPMSRYEYGPWDDRYGAIIGALVGRGLLRSVRGRRDSVALAPTPAGKKVAAEMAGTAQWSEVAQRSEAIAQASTGLSGDRLKEMIHQRMADLMVRPQQEVIR